MINFPEIDLKNEKVRVIFFVLGVMLFFLINFKKKHYQHYCYIYYY